MIAAVSQLQLGLTLGGRPAVASRAGAVNMKVGLVYSTTTGNTETVRRAAVAPLVGESGPSVACAIAALLVSAGRRKPVQGSGALGVLFFGLSRGCAR